MRQYEMHLAEILGPIRFSELVDLPLEMKKYKICLSLKRTYFVKNEIKNMICLAFKTM